MSKKDKKVPISARIDASLKKKMLKDMETSRPQVSMNGIIETALEQYYDDSLIADENLKHDLKNQ